MLDVSAILFYFVFNPASCWGRRGSAIVINNTLEKERMRDTVDFKEKAFGTFGPGDTSDSPSITNGEEKRRKSLFVKTLTVVGGTVSPLRPPKNMSKC